MQAMSNARWIGLAQLVRIGMQLVGLVVLARFLPPSEYGLMAMATVAINFASLLRDMGTAAAIVQKDDLNDDTTNTVFWLNIGLGTGLALILALFSPMIADWFRAPRLVLVLLLLALVFPMTSSAAVHQALLERASRFRLLARIEILSSAVALFAALVLAYSGAGVLSLVAQALVAAFLSAVQLWLANHWRPQPKWSSTEFKSLIKFSGHLTGFSFINFFARNADSLIIGRVLGAIALGIYSQAYKVMMFPLQSMTQVANRALFPVMSRQQNDIAEMAKLYFRSLSTIAAMTAPLMAGLWVLREPFVRLALGAKWDAVADILAWLAAVGFIQSLTSTTGSVFMATGRTDLLLRLGIIGTILQVAAFFIGVNWGIESVAICYLIANCMNLLPCFWLTTRQLKSPISRLFSILWKPILFSGVMLVALYPLKMISVNQELASVWVLAGGTIIGVAIYGGLLFKFSRDTVEDYKKFFGLG
ncbi:MOP flippase family protein [Actimicrobium antarcticum]|uniref:O83 family O-antigen flippase n=1 Tax=Actimicrobium antarcticum TaxID=1051899 RepID=A0ABP7T6I0_9BURK